MKISWLFGAASALLLSVPAAQASSVFTDYYDAGGILLSAASSSGGGGSCCRGGGSTTTSSDSWTFDITTDGFDPATQDVISATIDLNLKDDFDSWYQKIELASLTVDGVTTSSFDVDTGTTTITVTSLVSLNASGTLDVTLTATKGDFYFNSAKLIAVEDHPAIVPVPAAVWLFGSGLLGLAGIARRKKS